MIIFTRAVPQGKKTVVQNAADWPKMYSCNFLEPGLVSYEDTGAGIAMLRRETIAKLMPTFIGKPVIIDHIDVGPKDFDKHAVGYVTRVWWDDASGWARCEFLLTDDKAKQKVAQGYSVSCAYNVSATGPGGEYHAIKYDEEILDGTGTHLALVVNPRYEECKIDECMMLVNSKRATIRHAENRQDLDECPQCFGSGNCERCNNTGKVNKQKENAMIQLFRKANAKIESGTDAADPSKQKWNDTDSIFVKIENEYVPLSKLAEIARKNEFVPLEMAENEIEIDGAKHNMAELIATYKASKKNDDDNLPPSQKDPDAEEKVPKANADSDMPPSQKDSDDEVVPKNAKNEDGDEDEDDEDKKENEEDEEDEEKKEMKENEEDEDDKKEQADEEEDVEESIKRGNKSNSALKKRDVKHFVRLNAARQVGSGGQPGVLVDTMHSRLNRGKERYGSGR